MDSAFSMEADEMADLVLHIRHVEQALGKVDYTLTEGQKSEKRYGRSLFVCKDIKQGEEFSPDNIRSVRPGMGLSTTYYEQIIGKKAKHDIEYAEPLKLADIDW